MGAQGNGSKKRRVRQLLVVDDEQPIRELLRRHFQYLGYQVSTAEDPKVALQYMERNRVDVVVSDITMPGMTGVELLTRIREEYPMVRVVMITGYVTQENVLACMRSGAETCIFKPLEDLDALEQAVERAAQNVERWWQVLADMQARRPGRSATP